MLTRKSLALCEGLAILAGLSACAHSEATQVTAANAASAKAVGERLAQQDRENEEAHRKALASLMRVDSVRVNEKDRTMTIAFDAHNLSPKRVTKIEAGFMVTDPSGKRIAMTEVRTSAGLAPRSSAHLSLTIPYVQFGEDTGAMREAVGKPQRYALDVKEIKYADGSDAGYDD